MRSAVRRLRLVLLCAVLFAALAVVPARAASAAEGAEPAVTLGFVSWEPGLSGSWSTLTAVVKNSGARFQGELHLNPVLSLEERLRAIARPATAATTAVGTAAPSVVLRGPTYAVPIVVDAGGERTVSLTVPVGDTTYLPKVIDLRGRTVATTVALTPPLATPEIAAQLKFGVLTDTPEMAGLLFGRFVFAGGADKLPTAVGALHGLDVVMVGNFDSGGLNNVQRRALFDFVALGGRLVIAGGVAGERTTAGLDDALVPLRPTGMATASLAPLAELNGGTGGIPLDVAVVTGELRRGRVVLAGPGGPPLVVEADVGAGRVVQLAYDPLAMLHEDRSVDALLRQVSAGVGIFRAAGVSGQIEPAKSANEPVSVDAQLAIITRVLQEQAAPTAPRSGPALTLLLGYAALIVVALLWGRRLRHAARIWLPLAATTVGVTAVAAAMMLAARDPLVDHQVSIERISGDTGRVEAYDLVERRSGMGMTAALPSGAQAWVGPVPLLARQPVDPATAVGFFKAVPDLRDDTDNTAAGSFVDGVVRVRAEATNVEIGTLTGGQARIVRTLAATRPAVTIEAHVRLEGGRLKGSLTNHGTAAVTRLRAYSAGGGHADLAPVLAPGATVDVDAALNPPAEPAPSGKARSARQRADAILEAAARPVDRGSTPGQVTLVGLAVTSPSLRIRDAERRSTSLGVVVTTVEVESADDLNGDLGFGVPRLVFSGKHRCCTNDLKAVSTSIYEFLLSDGPPELFAVFPGPKPEAQPAIYDHETFEWVPLDPGKTHPFHAGQVKDRRVLVRTTSPLGDLKPEVVRSSPEVESAPAVTPPQGR